MYAQTQPAHIKSTETELVKERIPLWFDSFIKHSDEKMKIADLIGALIAAWQKDGYLSNDIKILDIGCAGGELSSMVIQKIKDYQDRVKFYCVENRQSYTTKAKEALMKIGVKHTVIQEDCFNYNFKILAEEFDLIIVSHVAYYDIQAIPKFIKSLLEAKTKNGFMIFIHEAANSIPNQLRLKYLGPTSSDTSKAVHDALEKSGAHFFTGKLYSQVAFADYDLLRAESEHICVSKEQVEFKYLSEFIIQRPLEALYNENTLGNFISNLTKITCSHESTLIIETDIEIATPNSHDFRLYKPILEEMN